MSQGVPRGPACQSHPGQGTGGVSLALCRLGRFSSLGWGGGSSGWEGSEELWSQPCTVTHPRGRRGWCCLAESPGCWTGPRVMCVASPGGDVSPEEQQPCRSSFLHGNSAGFKGRPSEIPLPRGLSASQRPLSWSLWFSLMKRQEAACSSGGLRAGCPLA